MSCIHGVGEGQVCPACEQKKDEVRAALEALPAAEAADALRAAVSSEAAEFASVVETALFELVRQLELRSPPDYSPLGGVFGATTELLLRAGNTKEQLMKFVEMSAVEIERSKALERPKD